MPDRFRLVYRFPLPPSGNRATRYGNGRHYKPTWIDDFRASVAADVLLQGRKPTIDSPVGIIVRLADVAGDITNRLKTIEDAITKARVWTDDKLVRAQQNYIDPSMPKDRCVVVVCDLGTYWREVESLAGRQAKEATR
jgi:Holliday junction resolvase RusA-like endonuclease